MMDQHIKEIAEFVAYILVGLGGLGMVLSKLGLFSFSKKKDDEGNCPEPRCKREVITIKEKTTTHDRQISELFKAQLEMREDVAFIRGRLEGAKIIRLEE